MQSKSLLKLLTESMIVIIRLRLRVESFIVIGSVDKQTELLANT